MKIILASDHGAFELKKFIQEKLEAEGQEVLNLGVNEPVRIDYPDKAEEACERLKEEAYDLAILFCGTGIGMSIAANKISGIRAAHIADVYSARMAKQHNNANVICIGGRTIGPELAWAMVSAFLESEFEGGRHAERIEKIMSLEDRA